MNQAVKAKATPIITLISRSCEKLLTDRASLPSMPDVAARIHSALSSPNWSISTIATIIKGDPGTTTYLLRMANSAMYAGVAPIQEVEQAVSRVGVDNTRNLVMAHALRSMFMTSSRMLSALMRKTWQRSARLAALATVLARQCPRMSPERALLAGLLQDIGVLPILHVLNQYHDQLKSEAQALGVVDRYAPQVGQVLLTQWEFDSDMVDVARSRGDWLRDPGPVAELADLVLVVRLHDNIVEGKADGLPQIDEIPAFAKLPLGDVSTDSGLECLHAEQASVDEILRSLGAD